LVIAEMLVHLPFAAQRLNSHNADETDLDGVSANGCFRKMGISPAKIYMCQKRSFLNDLRKRSESR
jgi:hypothetical protein